MQTNIFQSVVFGVLWFGDPAAGATVLLVDSSGQPGDAG